MLAELAAANAAIAVIKSAIANGKELSQLGSKVFDYFDNEAVIQEKLTKNGGASDSAEFGAMEQLRQQKEHLRQAMVYAGRPGLWDDWVAFQAQAARRRREQKEAETRRIALRKKKAEQLVEYLVLGTATVVLAVMMVYGIVLYIKYLR